MQRHRRIREAMVKMGASTRVRGVAFARGQERQKTKLDRDQVL